MVAKWDLQQALKPPAFDQDDYVTSVDGLFDIAVTSRGGRLNMGWKKASPGVWIQIYSFCHTSHASALALLLMTFTNDVLVTLLHLPMAHVATRLWLREVH